MPDTSQEGRRRFQCQVYPRNNSSRRGLALRPSPVSPAARGTSLESSHTDRLLELLQPCRMVGALVAAFLVVRHLRLTLPHAVLPLAASPYPFRSQLSRAGTFRIGPAGAPAAAPLPGSGQSGRSAGAEPLLDPGEDLRARRAELARHW